MACRAFDYCNDAAQRYLKDVKSERHLIEKNVKSLEDAKREIEALIRESAIKIMNEKETR